MRASNRCRASGFTLLEVLAALVIISLGMLGVIEAIGQTASNRAYMREKTIAHWVAMNRLVATRLELRAPKVDKTSDEVEMAGERWRWTMEVQQTPVKTVFRIDVRVGKADADKESSLASVTGFYGTAIAASGMSASVWQPPNVPGAPGTEEQPPGTKPPNDQPEEPPPVGEPVDPPINDEPETP